MKLTNLKFNSGVLKYLKNTSWLLIEKLLRIFMGLFVTIWMARYLGPEQFGVYSYAFSFVALFGVFSTFGVESLINKELINSPNKSNELLGSAFLICLFGSLLMFTLVVFSISLIRPNNELMLFLVVVFSSAFFFKSFEVIRYWFESHVQAKYSSIVFFIGMMTSAIVRVYLILNSAPLLYFAYVVLLESIIVAVGLVISYTLKANRILNWVFAFQKIKYLIKASAPVMLSGMVAVIFMRIDQLMLGSMLGDESVGIYAAAVRISEGWMFIPGAIAASFFPALLNARKNQYSLYLERTQNLLSFMVIVGVLVAIVISLLASSFITFAFGSEYDKSANVLIIHVWGMVFNAVGIVSFRYFIAEGLQIYSFYRASAGLLINIVLNYVFIPEYGVYGAAISTVISQGIAVYVLNSVSSKTRDMFLMQTKAFTFYTAVNKLKGMR